MAEKKLLYCKIPREITSRQLKHETSYTSKQEENILQKLQQSLKQ